MQFHLTMEYAIRTVKENYESQNWVEYISSYLLCYSIREKYLEQFTHKPNTTSYKVKYLFLLSNNKQTNMKL